MTTVPGPRSWSLGPWPFDATTLMLTLHSAHRSDFVIDEKLAAEWADAGASSNFQRVRTSAVGPGSAEALMALGFVVRQELDFLVADLADHRHPQHDNNWRIGRIRAADAVRIDIAAFGDEWALDEVAFHNSCAATQLFRVRGARGRRSLPASHPLAYCLTGASEGTSYLQRLAVSPTARRRGAAGALLADAMRWALGLGAQRMFVNTDLENAAALSLYQQWGFEPVGYHLRVMECDRTTLLSRGGHR